MNKDVEKVKEAPLTLHRFEIDLNEQSYWEDRSIILECGLLIGNRYVFDASFHVFGGSPSGYLHKHKSCHSVNNAPYYSAHAFGRSPRTM